MRIFCAKYRSIQQKTEGGFTPYNNTHFMGKGTCYYRFSRVPIATFTQRTKTQDSLRNDGGAQFGLLIDQNINHGGAVVQRAYVFIGGYRFTEILYAKTTAPPCDVHHHLAQEPTGIRNAG